jgi:hypothetical protein
MAQNLSASIRDLLGRRNERHKSTNDGDNHCLLIEIDPLGQGCCYTVFADQAI